MIERYTLPEMRRIWSEEYKFQKWLEIEILACEAQAALGNIPEEALAAIKERARFDVRRILELEAVTRHDVIAFLTCVGEYVGEAARYIHMGLTSSDILDTALALRMREAGEQILNRLERLREVLLERAREHRRTLMMGRTHGVHAEPMVFGQKFALWAFETARDLERLRRARDVVSYGKISGAVGTYAHLDPWVEAYVCERLGLKPAEVSTQVLQRDRHAEYLAAIAIAGAFASGMAGNLGMLGLPAIVLLTVGFGFKASLAPFHQWAPDAYEGAPTPITAFLSTASKATGFALLARVFAIGLPMFRAQEWAPLLGAIAIVTMTLGNLVAIQQTNLKRLLAYSSIAQAGYIAIGLASMASTGLFGGLEGALLYLFAYLFTNLGAFLVVIAVENATGAVDLPAYAGLARRSPLLAGMLVLFLLSLAAIPPTGGFLGKFLVFGAAIRSQLLALAIIAIVNSAIAAFYYLNIVRYMFFMPAPAAQANEIAAPTALRVPLWICAAMTLAIGLVAQPFIDWATRSAVLLAAAL